MRFPVYAVLRRRPPLIIAILGALLVWIVLLSSPLAASTRTILAFDAGWLLFLGFWWWLMLHSRVAEMRQRARLYDEGARTILILTISAAIFSLVSVGLELNQAKGMAAFPAALHAALAMASLCLSWVVAHTIFAIHYAHLHYSEHRPRVADGLDFPGSDTPGYMDFIYFAFVIGMTCQTSDVAIRSPDLRRLALVHGLIAFLFNTVILAYTINVAAGLI